jgi:hypothetical protein
MSAVPAKRMPNGKGEKEGAVTLAAVVTEGLLSPVREESRHVSVTASMV